MTGLTQAAAHEQNYMYMYTSLGYSLQMGSFQPHVVQLHNYNTCRDVATVVSDRWIHQLAKLPTSTCKLPTTTIIIGSANSLNTRVLSVDKMASKLAHSEETGATSMAYRTELRCHTTLRHL